MILITFRSPDTVIQNYVMPAPWGAGTLGFGFFGSHYNDVIMSVMAYQITSLTIVHSTVYSGADQRKHQSSASLAFVRGIHRWPVNSPHKGPVTRKMLPFDIVIMIIFRPSIVEYHDFNHFSVTRYRHSKLFCTCTVRRGKHCVLGFSVRTWIRPPVRFLGIIFGAHGRYDTDVMDGRDFARFEFKISIWYPILHSTHITIQLIRSKFRFRRKFCKTPFAGGVFLSRRIHQ